MVTLYKEDKDGNTVKIGNRSYKVTKDGRVNIPKKVMDEFGITGEDKRKRIAIKFSSKRGKQGWKEVGAAVANPSKLSKDLKTGKSPVYDPSELLDTGEGIDELIPETEADFTWT